MICHTCQAQHSDPVAITVGKAAVIKFGIMLQRPEPDQVFCSWPCWRSNGGARLSSQPDLPLFTPIVRHSAVDTEARP